MKPDAEIMEEDAHKKNNSPSVHATGSFSSVVHVSLEEHADEWDHLIPPDHLLHSSHLLILEKSKLDDIEFRYLFIYKNITSESPKPVAIAYFQLVHFRSKHYLSVFKKNNPLHLLERIMMRKGFRILVCGNLFRVEFPGIFIGEDIVSSDEIISIVHQFSKSFVPKAHAILIKDVVEDWSHALLYNGFRKWPDDLTMKLNMNPAWKSFEDYVSALRHKYAQRVRKARMKYNGVLRRELSSREINHYSEQIEELYLNIVNRQTIRLVIVNANYFVEMKNSYAERFKLFGYFLGDRMVAFSSNILYDELWELHYIGMDYQENEKHWLYFNILFDSISDAIVAGKKELEMGRTAREAKAIVGGSPLYFISYYRLNGILIHRLVQIFSNFFNKNAGTGWEKHHSFKTNLLLQRKVDELR